MKKLFMALSIFTSFSMFANDNIQITELTFETPLPTGLESTGASPIDGSPLFKHIATADKNTHMLLSVAVIGNAKKVDNIFKSGGRVAVNCSDRPAPFGDVDTSRWGFTATADFGWYADIDFGVKIKGYIKEQALKNYTSTFTNGNISYY